MAEKWNHGFCHVPEVNCCLTVRGEHDPTDLKPVLESKEKRDAANSEWREYLLEVWKMSNQQSKGNFDSEQLDDKKRWVQKLLSEVVATNKTYQGCLDNYYGKLPSTNEITVCNLAMSKSFWFPQNPVQIDPSPLSSEELDVKYCGSESQSFSNATVGYIKENFKQIDGAHRVPYFLFVDDEYNTGTRRDSNGRNRSGTRKITQLSHYSDDCLKTHPQLKDKDLQRILDNRRSVEAVKLVGDKLIECHDESLPGGMFVISNLKHQKYLVNVLKSMKNKATSSDSYGSRAHVTAQDGDHDIVVIHRKIGVIFIQVKGCSPTSTPKNKIGAIQLALKQVMKDKFVFYEGNRDLDFVLNGRLPVYGFVAVPFVKKSDVQSLGICSNHFDKILTACDLECLHEWLKGKVKISVGEEPFAFTENEYMMLCGRYVGLLSEVTMRTFEEGNKKLGQKMESLFLTPDQIALVQECEERYVCVSGDFGTGKSLVLVEKAKKMVEEDKCSVAFVISCSDIDNFHLCKLHKRYKSADQLEKRFLSFEKDRSISHRIRVMQFCDVLRDMSGDDIKEITKITPGMFHRIILGYVTKKTKEILGDVEEQNFPGRCHIFLDELSVGFFLKEPNVSVERGTHWDNINLELPEGSFCWVSACPHTYRMTKTDAPDRIKRVLPPDFKYYYLNRIMRVPGSVCDLVKGIEDHVGKGHHVYSYVGHTFKGSKPLLTTLPRCPCTKGEVILCTCSSQRLESSLRKIRESFDFTTLLVVVIMFMFHCGEHLLPLFRQYQEVLQIAFAKFDVTLEWNTMYGSQIENSDQRKVTISVVDQHTFIGCESRNVMCIDMFGMHQWFNTDRAISEWFSLIVNRCTAHYIHINWPKEEARAHWSTFLEGYESYCNEQGVTWQGAIFNLAKESKGLCVESLKENKLVQEIFMD